ncbi:MAG: TolC family protein [Planctomycetia bacterium]|nr:TolC family protein [Planctomycetia bacterium]
MDFARKRIAAFLLPCLMVSGLVPSATLAAEPPAHAHASDQQALQADLPEPLAGPVAGQRALSLGDLEQMALERNPTLAQAAAQIAASRGAALEAGLYPNPIIGYEAEQIGAAGTAGEIQGGFVQQTIVTAGKLRLSRAKYRQEAFEAGILAMGQQLSVLNGVRMRFYELLADLRMIELDRELLKNAEENFRTTREMFNTGLANEADVLLAEIEVNRAQVAAADEENSYVALWQHLASVIGWPDLPPTALEGQLEPTCAPLEWETSLIALLQSSPEIAAARAHVVHDRITVQRERVQPVPDVRLQASTGYNFETRNAVAGQVQMALNVPLWDKNQGTIAQAQAELSRSNAEVQRVELSLRQRLADVFRQYRTALLAAQLYRDANVPKAAKAYEIQLGMYNQRRVAWPEVVKLQRNLFQVKSEYTRNLLDLRKAEVAITGLLMVDGLTAPPSPRPGGHINATPRPR